MLSFEDLDEHALSGALVILDVDGTLLPDKGDVLERHVGEKVRRLAQTTELFLFSNGHRERTRSLAKEYGAGFIDSTHSKPSRRVIEGIARDGKRLIVIGDKSVTDGLFAANVGAEFVPVRRIRHAGDGAAIRLIYIMDDIASSTVRAVFPMLPYVILMRPLQWIKNILVFAPVFFASEATQPGIIMRVGVAAAVFCAVSSAMYIFNDLRDVEQDRLHPAKRSRPIASGAISVAAAWTMFGLLLALAVIGFFMLPAIVPAILAYAFGNILYSTLLKNIAIIDITAIAFFYVLRIIAGGEASATYVSPWIILCVLFGALFLVVGKRRAEFAHSSRRAVLASYTHTTLDMLLAASATLAVTSYGLYSVLGAHSPYAVYSTIFVFAAVFRLLNRMYAADEGAEYPETFIFKDRWVLGLGAAWMIFMLILFYH